MTYRVEKTTSEVYTIRFDDHRDWFIQATIIEDRGYLALHTSHGDWQYRWGSPGKSFKHFLTTLDDSYLMGKLGQRDFFEGNDTVKQIKNDVIEKRKQTDISAEDARTFINFVSPTKRRYGAYYLDISNVEMFHRSLDEEIGRNLIEKIYGEITYVPCYMGYDPSLRYFVKNLWPSFVEELNKEKLTPDVLRLSGVNNGL
jgi:hypothetical protein